MKILIAIPCMDMMHTAFVNSLMHLMPVGDTDFKFMASSLVYDSRNQLAQKAIDGGYDRVLWLDSDMTFGPDLLMRLSADADEGREFVSGLYFTRKNPVRPVIYKELGYTQNGRELTPYNHHFEKYPRRSVFEVKAAGFGAVIVSTRLLRQLYAEYGAPFSPQPGFGEDLSFCIRCEASGIKMYCDSRVKLGHVAQTIITEEGYTKGVIL